MCLADVLSPLTRHVFPRIGVLGLACLLLTLAPSRNAHAQQMPPDTSRAAPDSVQRSAPDSLQQRPSSQGASPNAPSQARDGGGPEDGSGGAGVQFTAQDSLVIRLNSDGGNQGTLHGESEMSYQGATLRARTIEMDFGTGKMRATGSPTDTAEARPVFERSGGGSASGPGSRSGGPAGAGGDGGGGSQSFTGKALSYNIRTKRGRVVTARTQRKDGYIQGGVVKMFEDSTLFVRDGSYTTCNCPPTQTPSYSLRSTRMKVEDQWVYTGPIQLYLFNIPTPLWLPFGFLPNTPGRRSGPLPPSYGQDARGLYLKDWGWYFAMNEYTDLQLRAGVWSQGSYQINPIFRYEKRYSYGGRLDFTYRRDRRGEEQDPDFQNRHEGQLRWNHQQELGPNANLSGNVDLVTSSDFAQRNSERVDDAVRQQISSTVSYSKSWPSGGQSMDISLRQQQQIQSGQVSTTLPDFSFSQRQFKPFQFGDAVGGETWYEKITTRYSLDVSNSYQFTPRDPDQLRQRGDSTLADSLERADIAWYDALVDRRQYRLATGNDEPFDFSATHQVPLSASFRLNRYNLSFSPSVRYTSDWYINTQRAFVRRDTTRTDSTLEVNEERIERTVPGFYARHDFSTSFSSSTEFYGIFPVGVGPFEGVRHRVSPSLSFSYKPNFNNPIWGRTRTLRDASGAPVIDTTTGRPRRYDILGGNAVRGSNEQRNLSFSLRNEFETKRVEVDSTGERSTETITILNLDLQGISYNFAADSLKLSDIRLDARTQIERFRVNMGFDFSPYGLARPSPEAAYRVVDRYMAVESPSTPVRLTDFDVSVTGDVQGGSGGGGAGRSNAARSGAGRSGVAQSRRAGGQPSQRPPMRSQRNQSTRNQSGYPNFEMPWSLSFSFNYRLSRPAKRIESQTATLSTNFSLGVTPLWSVSGQTGYDFIERTLSTTRLSIRRDLGCWFMSFSWVPFGRYQSYSFNLQVKSGQLSQLLQLQIPNKGGEGRLGGIGNRLQQTAGSVVGGGAGGSR
jgi:lipopolysaccharide assembly outer membrane protein LptD (OstA)